jgi:P2-related tail formation protein
MIEFEIHDLFPDFLLADRNGYAMAKAIMRGLEMMCETVQNGLDIVLDVDKMPEWRLDEMAWELGCLFDYNADIETKRRWIRDAMPMYSALGTPRAIYNYLEGYFDHVELEENWEYGGEPYHFRVNVTGEWSQELDDWVKKAIATVKNVRSVLDTVTFNAGASTAQLSLGAATAGWEILIESVTV